MYEEGNIQEIAWEEKNDAEAMSFLENFMWAKNTDFWLKTVKKQKFVSHFGSLTLNQKGIFQGRPYLRWMKTDEAPNYPMDVCPTP